ncbi:ABC transporter permease [Micromonospora echinofusca]|uniref:Transport permease protein n=1 Tax=Micromonospora echinofusca TaxID=47858 RepID=A0ABS3W1R5_MICEH|nr:ABC transporter permease [Micromonospora echinofusca]MBO4210671.1 ABC transporter permease [Micromonospora echinofusca]
MRRPTAEISAVARPSGPPATVAPPPVATSLWHRVDEVAVLVRRNLIHMRRRPALLIFSLIEPVLLVLLFRFVFGGAVEMSIDTTYPNFMVPGILVQTVTLGAVTIGASLARDLYGGMLDRFRSLPIARASVLAGHTIAGLARSLLVLLAMVATGALVGFRPQADPLAWVGALALLLLCALAMAWVSALIALLVGGVEMVETLGLSLLFPLTLVSSAFVPVETMPGAVGAFAAHQPVTAVVDAVRALLLDQPLGNTVWVAVAWAVGTIAVFAPLSALAYRRRTRH